MSARHLRGITWDHPRGFDPLQRGAKAFMDLHPGISIEWERRSLSRFGVEPLQALCERFDLVVINHPFCGEAAASGCLLDLSHLMPQEFLRGLLGDSVGPSTASYWHRDAVWALPTDAAAQVACSRPDLLERLEVELPRSFDEVVSLAKRSRARALHVALPLCPDDAVCVFFTLLANLGCRPSEERSSQGIELEVADEALARLAELASFCHPSSTRWIRSLRSDDRERRDCLRAFCFRLFELRAPWRT